jgi:sarcosine oxidase subunit gamma
MQTIRRGPLDAHLAPRARGWMPIADGAAAAHLADEFVEAARLAAVALCDLSALPKLCVKGPAAADWLHAQGIDVPAEMYAAAPLADGGLAIRTGGSEFFLESGPSGRSVPELDARLAAAPPGCYRVERQDATLLVCGPKSPALFAQTCSLELAAMPARRLIYTRVAGVNCGIWPEDIDTRPAFRLWCDASYAESLWESLEEIAIELGGGAVGIAAAFPQWAGSAPS